MGTQTPPVNKALDPAVINIAVEFAERLGLMEALRGLISRAIASLFRGNSKTPAQPPVPTAGGGNTTRLPDDVQILPPANVQPPLVVTKVDIVVRAQYNRELFPEMYTEANPHGMYQNAMELIRGNSAFSRRTKFWFDMTVRIVGGIEFTGAQIVAYKKAYKTRHTVKNLDNGGITAIDGTMLPGTLLPGSDLAHPKPMPGYTQVEESGMGLGITPWEDSVGLVAPMKAFVEGEFEYEGEFDGHKTETLRFRVS